MITEINVYSTIKELDSCSTVQIFAKPSDEVRQIIYLIGDHISDRASIQVFEFEACRF